MVLAALEELRKLDALAKQGDCPALAKEGYPHSLQVQPRFRSGICLG